MSEVNVLWSSAWLKMQKNLARGVHAGESAGIGSSYAPQGSDTVFSAGSWLVRARRGNTRETSLRL
jgi:hypothetical protein